MTPERKKARRRQRIWLWLTAAALVVTLVILLLGTLRYAREAEQANAQLQRQVGLNARVRQMQGILVALWSAESGQRGYLLTGKPAYLAAYDDAVRSMPSLLSGMTAEPSVPGLEAKTQAISEVVGLKLAELAETIRLHKAGRRDEALALVNTDAGQSYMVRARSELDQAMDVIRKDRDAATHKMVAATDATRRTAVATVAALTILTVFAVFQIVRLSASQRRFAADLSDSERFVRDITNSLPVHVTYFDADLKIQFINDAQLRRVDRHRDEVIGKSHHEFLEPRVSEALTQRLKAALAGEPQHFEYEDPSGTPLLIRARMTPDVDQHGIVKGIYTTGVDITDLKSTERRLRELTDILENTPDFIVQTNVKGRVQYMNPAARESLGFSVDEDLARHTYAEFNTPDTNRRYASEILPAVAAGGVWMGETTVLAAGGRVVPVNHMVIAHADPNGAVERYSAVMRDISSVLANRLALVEQTATLEAIVESIPAMVAVFDADIHYRLVNRAFERWRGRERSEVLGRGIAELFGEHEFARSLPWIKRALAGETVSFEKDYPGADSNKNLSISYVPMRMADGTVRGFVAVAQDITLHREEERRLLDMAERDALTGALNRAGFDRYLQDRVDAGDGASLALLYVDLDEFKPVNDNFGHPAGDDLLAQFADRLKRLVRPTDIVARLGGDEFAIVLNGVRAKADANAVADKIVKVAKAPFLLGEQIVSVGASVGVAFGGDMADGIEGLLSQADAALYKAKKAGRGQRA